MEISIEGKYDTGNYAELFAALADPLRLRILDRLRRSESTVSQLSEELAVGMPSVSKHLNVLEQRGLIIRRRQAQRRLCALSPAGFSQLSAWLDNYEVVWTERLSRLSALVEDGDEE